MPTFKRASAFEVTKNGIPQNTAANAITVVNFILSILVIFFITSMLIDILINLNYQ
ncbi:hypothetical protein PHSC3_001205 [Chlamydiales bacterium STE3]|nr:hypothetical protein PHSC3_001205 [Chlamydiales bacterium STE3]